MEDRITVEYVYKQEVITKKKVAEFHIHSSRVRLFEHMKQTYNGIVTQIANGQYIYSLLLVMNTISTVSLNLGKNARMLVCFGHF